MWWLVQTGSLQRHHQGSGETNIQAEQVTCKAKSLETSFFNVSWHEWSLKPLKTANLGGKQPFYLASISSGAWGCEPRPRAQQEVKVGCYNASTAPLPGGWGRRLQKDEHLVAPLSTLDITPVQDQHSSLILFIKSCGWRWLKWSGLQHSQGSDYICE